MQFILAFYNFKNYAKVPEILNYSQPVSNDDYDLKTLNRYGTKRNSFADQETNFDTELRHSV